MSEVLVHFDVPVAREGGGEWFVRARGREEADGRWSGWLEFSRDGDVWRATEIESVQPNRRDLEYWVTGLSRVYLEGALERALEAPPRVLLRDSAPRPEPRRTPPPGPAAREADLSPTPRPLRAILDPFTTYLQGEGVLRSELSALSPDHLRSIAAAFNVESPETASMMTEGELIDRIVGAARRRALEAAATGRPNDTVLRERGA